jgi:hypothetical protein
MKTLAALALFVSACSTAPETHEDVLPTDAYYIIATPECLASSNDPAQCAFELGFCVDGTYSLVLSLSGSAESGTYAIEDGVAIDDSNAFAFDFTTQQLVEPGTKYTTPWSIATGDENTLVVCGD